MSKNLFPLHIYRPNDYTAEIYLLPHLQFCNSFTIMFFPLPSKVFTGILKIYELSKIYVKKPKYCQTLALPIIIYQANSLSQLHRAFELYPY